ncbi:PDZ domain-containing protein [Babesia caballi]|uniref:PDZ domain-containing protein n=1 Tax=Babesia caballi TaxID=5871 RepID=A0AAV4M1Q1_BABCB|nr:PDZ domain-containing protein [Babesia caballi]
MFSGFDEFRHVDSSPKTFYDFLKKVEKQTKQELRNVNYVPLGALYLFTYQYLKEHKSDLPTNDGIPTNENDLTALLQKLGEAVKRLDGANLTKLSSAYDNLSEAITNALNTPDPVGESSVVGPVSGTLPLPGCSVPDRPCTSTSAAPVHF